MPNLNDIKEVFYSVRSSIIYTPDQIAFGKSEYWKSWKEEVSQGHKFLRDDCDGFALTMAEMLIARGFEKKDVAICFCAIQQPPRHEEYHLLCKVRNPEDNVWYVMDNNVSQPQPRDNSGGPGWNFRWMSCMYADNVGDWVEDV